MVPPSSAATFTGSRFVETMARNIQFEKLGKVAGGVKLTSNETSRGMPAETAAVGLATPTDVHPSGSAAAARFVRVRA